MDIRSILGWPHRHNKRTHEQMEQGHSRRHSNTRSHSPLFPSHSRTPLHSSPSPAPQSSNGRPATGLQPPPLGRRYPGDGLDFRRPVSSTPLNNTTVIDLTSEDSETSPSGTSTPIVAFPASRPATRPPRYDREIIDLSADTEPAPPNPPPEPPNQSPEVQFVSSRQLPPPQRRPVDFPIVDLDLIDDDFQILGENVTGRGANHGHPAWGGHHVRANGIGLAGLRALLGNGARQAAAVGGRYTERLARRLGANPEDIIGFQAFAAPMLDYEAAGFDLGLNQRQPPTPTYEAPPEAPIGFTRSPVEEDVLLCPNCGDELCTGNTDVKKQVWALKNCGHIYCGQCVKNRAITKRKGKDPAMSKPFKVCVVEDCGKACAGRGSVIQLFL